MNLSYKMRRRLALLALLVGLPTYLVVAITLVGWISRPSILVELIIYVGLGVLWILPLRKIFMGVGRPAPQETKKKDIS